MNAAILAGDSTTDPIGVGVPPFPKPHNLGIEWDAENRLLAVNEGTYRSEFTYGGFGHRTRNVEKDGGLTTSDHRYLWCRWSVCEERDSDGVSIVRQFFNLGLIDDGDVRFLSLDHLGSVREITDTTSALEARYDYDPFGQVTKLTGNVDASFTYTGYYDHVQSGLLLAPRRAYDAAFGKFLSEDPVRSEHNAYTYASNNPVTWRDPLGLFKTRMDAALDFMSSNWAKSQRGKREYCARICLCSDGEFILGPVSQGPVGYEFCYPKPCPAKTTNAGRVHTHWLLETPGLFGPPYVNDDFSDWDRKNADREGVPSFLGNPSRELREYIPVGVERTHGDIFELLKSRR